MAAAVAHRGPDGEAFFAAGPIALGHRRLSIIDLAGGAQPQFNEEGTVAVVCNGEIYNYRELATELRPRHLFRTESDTEVLVHLYEDYGEEMVPRLRGMFAFALWDSRRERLLAARDRFGEKPFLYSWTEGVFTFASEMVAMRAAGQALGDIDLEALSDYLELLYIPAPRTIFTRVHKLPAGHLLAADRTGVRIRPYWDAPVPGSRSESRAASPADLRRLLEEAVRLRLRSDVPVAALLSGGIDSSAVVGLMAKELGPGVKTFSVGFGRDDDELQYARVVAERHRTDHSELMVRDDTVAQTAEALAAYSEPFGDSSAVPTVALCREVARHVKVVLTGDGGDELFAGYGRYRQLARFPHLSFASVAAPWIERLPYFRRRGSLRRLSSLVGSRGMARYRALVEVFSLVERCTLLGQRARTAASPANLPNDVDSALSFDLTVYLPDDLLVKMDIASMRWGLEARAPLLDHVLADMAVPLNVTTKQSRTEGKLIFKAAVADLVPPAILRRKKRGFGSPVESWLAGPLRPMLEDFLRPRNAWVRGFMDGKALDLILDRTAVRSGNAHQAWALLALEAWSRSSARS